MAPSRLIWLCLCATLARAQSAEDLRQCIRKLTLDPQQTYRVRDIHVRKGDVNFYLNEGVLSFATPIDGQIIAAVFTTRGVDAGDAEVLVLPPQPSERASLAAFTKTPNMDEHFSSAVFFFTDDTRSQILSQIHDLADKRMPEVANEIAPTMDTVLQTAGAQIDTRILRSLLSGPEAGNEFFFSVILGQRIGAFDVLYEPSQFEPVTVGNVPDKGRFQLWAAYRPRALPEYELPAPAISNYRIDATIDGDLTLRATADFDWKAAKGVRRAISLSLSRHLRVDSASVNGQAAEVVQDFSPDFSGLENDGEIVIVPAAAVTDGSNYHVTVKYQGAVIRRVSESSYFVSERNIWYPHDLSMLTTFDLTFHVPARFQLVATGELESDEVSNGVRTVHRQTHVAEQLAGFNLGEYRAQAIVSGPYRIECYADRSAAANMNNIPQQCEGIVQDYTRQWSQLPNRTLAVTPIPGYFGQGFPGLIYLSTTAYLPEKERPLEVQNPRANTFFEDVLLPHEIAHQWWGNLVSAANYRVDWLMESMANYSALQLLEQKKGEEALNTMLESFRTDLRMKINDKTIESTGPVDFGRRLLAGQDERAWHAVVYEKGSWILHMLRERMGVARFHEMQVSILQRYAGKAITNEQFREAASAFIPPKQPDRTLAAFFETWVYGTGLPRLKLNKTTIYASDVDDDFTVDVPLHCRSRSGVEQERWLRVVSGENPIPLPFGTCALPKTTEFLYVRE